MSSRVYKSGTVITRIKNLINNGVLTAPPLWLDVVEKFPPLKETRFTVDCVSGRPPEIVYDKDLLLKEYYYTYHTPKEVTSLFETDYDRISVAERFVKKQIEEINKGASRLVARETVYEEMKEAYSIKRIGDTEVESTVNDSEQITQELKDLFLELKEGYYGRLQGTKRRPIVEEKE